MGGSAFSSAAADGQPCLRTPRITREAYEYLRIIYKERISAFFGNGVTVNTLQEAPGKSSYGDIDFVVGFDGDPDWYALAAIVGAKGLIKHHAGMCSLAVPTNAMNGSTHHQPVLYKHVHGHGREKSPEAGQQYSRESYAQIDVERVPARLWSWHMFVNSYGGRDTTYTAW
jgi:hypothetical protein